ncbi:amidophosphoribosyltransferase [Solibaculum mannosilyticum]|uniref:Amidophosphoribosyltransferase n=2 Tax=Solibaculum mannosilyticum TaxID=2780922 RepID=A0A7I8D858_9FIRM|nr:amidophosphoribosyltransferase [Solibaculum mannosilyticum]
MMSDLQGSLPFDNKLHEECGIFGVFGCDDQETAYNIYSGLFALQHRGQESCGMAVNNNGVVSSHKDMGLVSDVFNKDILEKLPGQMGIGHVRYSTTGCSMRENTQPLVLKYIKGTLSIAHNGNLTNTAELRDELERTGAIFQTTTDSEVMSYLIARERVNCGSVEEAVRRIMPRIQGAYSLLVMSPRKLIAARDPHGFRPLVIGQLENAWVFASETCALDVVGAVYVRDVEPGEIVVADERGLTSIKTETPEKTSLCIFEYIYFARPDSQINGLSVYEARQESGRILARQHPVEADLVIGVPESGIDAAIGYSQASGIPYGKGFVKNNYVGRTFIKPQQKQRENAVRLKLNVLGNTVRGKRVVMLDDSIVRGTTSARLVHMLKNAGATEVHVRISSPPFLWPCYFGTDVPERSQLSAVRNSLDEICRSLGADSLGYLELDSLHEMLCGREIDYCDACFSGNYPVAPPKSEASIDQFVK